MELVVPFTHMALKSLITLFPLTVVLLAFRRLALSKTDNSWIYAGMCFFAAVTSAGILPWALGIADLNWVLLGLALLSPVAWIAVVLICDITRSSGYVPDALVESALKFAAESSRKIAPLVLRDQEMIEEPRAPLPVFVHKSKSKAIPPAPKPAQSQKTQYILSLARDIRGNVSSENRRTKLLPAPETRPMAVLKDS